MASVTYMADGTPIIEDNTDSDFVFPREFGRGFDEEGFKARVPEFGAHPDSMELIPESDYDGEIDRQEAEKSSLEHVYLRAGWENLDQGQDGYCWGHSTVHGAMVIRSRDGMPFAALSATGLCAKLMNGVNRGAWCGLSAQGAIELGIPLQVDWPQQDRRVQMYDKPETWQRAKGYSLQESFVDLARKAYDRNLTVRQLATSLLRNDPCPVDFDWWGHSVCALRWIRVEAGSYGLLILNSWKGWGRRGLGVLRGNRAVPMGALSMRTLAA